MFAVFLQITHWITITGHSGRINHYKFKRPNASVHIVDGPGDIFWQGSQGNDLIHSFPVALLISGPVPFRFCANYTTRDVFELRVGLVTTILYTCFGNIKSSLASDALTHIDIDTCDRSDLVILQFSAITIRSFLPR